MRKKQAGKVIRISKEIEEILKNKKKRNESFDALLRRCFSVPDRHNKPANPLIVLHSYFAIHCDGNPLVFLSEARAKGAAIEFAVRNGSKKIERVFKVVEVL